MPHPQIKQIAMFLRLPRNYNFITRLPANFEIKIIKKGNETSDGVWYLGRVGEHELNILSRVQLIEGNAYKIRKKDDLTLELLEKNSLSDKTGRKNSDIDFLG